MKKLNKLLFISIAYLLTISAYAQIENNQCSIMHKGTFFYGKKKDKKVIIDNNVLTENLGYGELIITSNIVWINDCEYYSTILKVSKFNKKYNVGDRLHVKITNVVDNKIYYTAYRNSYTWDGHFIKKKEKKQKAKSKKEASHKKYLDIFYVHFLFVNLVRNLTCNS